ncbi:MAG: IS91 family transposase [Candidatus Marinimicrobia bacterium]|nr:IS91 family transposase [Candidatus Neomarinimicrobiota bacterium]
MADILRRHGQEYLVQYKDRLLSSHKRALEDIVQCRTETLGGHLYRCEHCDDLHYSYHSCKNRHCPKCMNDSAEEWLEKQKGHLLPVKYFMATFTVPDELRKVFRSHQKVLYNILFRSSAEPLQTLAEDKHYVGGKIGMIGILQTWTRDLIYHPHIHYLIPGGGITGDGNKWRPAKKDFLMPVKALSVIYRAKFRDALKKTAHYHRVPTAVWKKKWVVHIEPVGTGLSALKYLAPYIFRVAISNNNIITLKDGRVTFRCKDSTTNKWCLKTILAEEFIRRFLQHILPYRFRKVRYYGFLSSVNREQLEKIKEQFGGRYIPIKVSKPEPLKNNTFCCPKCGSQLIWVEELPRKRGPPW